MDNNEVIKIGELPEEYFGCLLKYLKDDDVTDVDYNGRDLWIRDIYTIRKKVDEPELTPAWADMFTQHIADAVSKSFNKVENVLEAETKTLRITCVFDSVAMTGKTFCIRKTTLSPRVDYDTAIEEGYASKEILNLLINCIWAKMNVVICGMPGVGKTELAKFFFQAIPDSEKVITIEDNPELHYPEIKPEGDSIELRVDDNFDYSKAIKTCLRLNPDWMMLSEVRSVEAVHLIENWYAGVKGITTLHTDDVRKIPDRLLNMMPKLDAQRLENSVYDCLDIGLLIRKRKSQDGRRYRYIDQMCFFSRSEGENHCYPILEDGKLVCDQLPEEKLKMLRRERILDPFFCAPELLNMVKGENDEENLLLSKL